MGGDGGRGALRCSSAVVLLSPDRRTFPMPGALPVAAASLGLIALVCLHPPGLAARMLSIPPALYVGPDIALRCISGTGP